MQKKDINEFTTDSGFKVVHIKTKSKFSNLLMYTSIGSYCESKSKKGMAHILEHMMFKGTSHKTWEDINEIACDNVLNHNAYTGDYCTGYTADFRDDKLETAVELLTDQLLFSDFPETEIDQELSVIEQEYNTHINNPDANFYDFVKSTMFNTQINKPVIGDLECIKTAKRSDINKFISKYNKSNLIFVVTSRRKTSELKTIFNEYLKEEWMKPSLLEDKTPKINKQIISNYGCFNNSYSVDVDDSTQASVGMIFNCPPAHERPIEFEIIMEILTGDTSSVLYKKLREEKGLCYYINGFDWLDNGHDAIYMIKGMTSPKDTTLFQTLIIEELSGLKMNNGPSEKSFNTAKNSLLDYFDRKNENNYKFMSEIAKFKVYNKDFGAILNYGEELNKCTYESVLEYFNEFFSEDFFKTPYFSFVTYYH